VILGESALTETDKFYMNFAQSFEKNYVNQGFFEDRSIQETMEVGWRMLSILPKSELTRVKDEFIAQYYEPSKGTDR
jgi:V/A-type H+/Na+-transporting ATPase subunit B